MTEAMTETLNDTLNGTLPAAAAPDRRPRLPGWRERLLLARLSGLSAGRLTLRLPSGRLHRVVGSAPGPTAHIDIHHPRLVTRLALAGDMGLAEGYMAGEWDSPDIKALLLLGAANAESLSGLARGSWPAELFNRFAHRRRANTRAGSRRNIAQHYDLGNAFYACWLDPGMTYSSALFDGMDDSMAAAQHRKYRRLAEKLDLRPGERVLEIGCGWGGFAEIAARDFGCEVTAVTLSLEQAAYTRARMAALGLQRKVDVRVIDYRDLEGTFDKIASIEMFEAVGQEYWGDYFRVLKSRLKPGGRAALQIITIADAQFDAYRRNPEFIQRYIFPGGMLPSPGAFADAVAAAGMSIDDAFYFGPSYGETLRRWHDAFEDNWPRIAPMGFDERFRRMWRYYLKYCEAGFDLGRIDVGQFVIRAE